MSIKKITLGVIVLLLAGSIAGFFGIKLGNVEVSKNVEPKVAPDFSLKDFEGREVKLSDFRGKPVLANVWASWCPYCREELQDFVKLQEEFGDKIIIIAINRGEVFDTAKIYSDKLGVTGKIILLLDPEDSFYKSIQGFSMPETIFVDKDGFIRYHKRGQITSEEMRRRVQGMFEF